MYFENCKKSRIDKIVFMLMILIIIILLSILIIKIDNKENDKNYEIVDALSTNSEQTVENENKINMDELIKSVVGISKIKNVGSSIFLNNAEEKLRIGSGIILTDNGYIITNYHVAGDKYSNCFVTLYNGIKYEATVVWADSNIDLAIIKITATGLDFFKLGDSDKIKLAEDVYAIGNPIGIEFERTVTKGIISGKNRTIRLSNEDAYMEDLIQTDAAINEGNSGGPLINSYGELIGINSIKIDDVDKISFAIPINLVKPIIEKLERENSFEEAYLGIYGYDKEVTNYLDYNLKIDSGIYIVKLDSNSALKNVGVKEGQILTKIDGIEIAKMNDLKQYIYTKKPGDKVIIEIKENSIEMKNYEIILNKK